MNWTPATLPSSTTNWSAVAYGGGKFVAIADGYSNKVAYHESSILAKLVFNAGGSVSWVKE
jgi:hypothetical protein